jgi:hypothetical protein
LRMKSGASNCAHPTKDKKKKVEECWVRLSGVLIDHCDKLLWCAYHHTYENNTDKKLLVRDLDNFLEIATKCQVTAVGGYRRKVFNVVDDDNWWMLH